MPFKRGIFLFFFREKYPQMCLYFFIFFLSLKKTQKVITLLEKSNVFHQSIPPEGL